MGSVFGVSDARLEAFDRFRLPSIRGFGNLDWKKIAALSDEEFIQHYVGEMTLYFYEHARDALKERDYISNVRRRVVLRPIACSDCRLAFAGPSHMRRYYGNSLHSLCFARRWEQDRPARLDGENSAMVHYWDRIARLNNRISSVV